MKVAKLAILAGAVGLVHLDWKVVLGAFAGGMAAQLINAVNLRRVARGAVADHERAYHGESHG